MFFITPIGENGSKERKQSDFIMKYVLQPICDLFALTLIRADKIIGDGNINDDVVNCLSSAELCIADVSGLNSNVMFELGVRYKTSLPMIMVSDKNTKLPFDLFALRTIFFDDLSNVADCFDFTEALKLTIETFQETNYRKTSPEPSLSDIYKILKKIEVNFSDFSFPQTNSYKVNESNTEIEDLLQSLDPSDAFSLAYETNQITLAEQLLVYLKERPAHFYFNKVAALTQKGSRIAINEMEEILPTLLDRSSEFKEVLDAIGCLVSGYMLNDIAQSKLDYIIPIIDLAMTLFTSNREKASLLNQKQRLFVGASMMKEATNAATEVIQLDDEEPAYFYNFATILEISNDIPGAIEKIKKCIELSNECNDDHLALACKLTKLYDTEENRYLFKMYFEKLEKINPHRARLVRLKH